MFRRPPKTLLACLLAYLAANLSRATTCGPYSALQAEKLLGIASGQRRDGRGIETLNGRDMAERIVLRHVIGVVGAEQNVVRAEQSHQCGELGTAQGKLLIAKRSLVRAKSVASA